MISTTALCYDTLHTSCISVKDLIQVYYICNCILVVSIPPPAVLKQLIYNNIAHVPVYTNNCHFEINIPTTAVLVFLYFHLHFFFVTSTLFGYVPGFEFVIFLSCDEPD